PINSINVIVGPNNTGKSSLLESVWMLLSTIKSSNSKGRQILSPPLYDFFDSRQIKHLVNEKKEEIGITVRLEQENDISMKGVFVQETIPNDLYDPLKVYLDKSVDYERLLFTTPDGIKGFGSLLSVMLGDILKIDDENIKLDLNKDDLKKMEEDEELKNELKEFEEHKKTEIANIRKDIIRSEKIFLKTEAGEQKKLMMYSKSKYIDDVITLQEDIVNIPDIQVLFNSHHHMVDIGELYDELIHRNRLKPVRDYLQNKIPYLTDIVKSEEGMQVLLNDMNESIPLSNMGDGFNALVKLSFMAPMMDKGIAIFEEPEVTMHPGFLEILAEEILNNSENTQFFITSHSHEFVEYMLTKAREKNRSDSINIIRMERLPNGRLDREIISGEDALEEVEKIKTDLRGY
ncbi:MAG: ATP-binding protein, partial [Thermoplasmata archaeon]